MPLDRARSDEQGLRDLAIRQVLARELGDAALARRERLDAAEDDAPRPGAGRPQLGLGARSKRSGARAMRRVERLAQQLARLAAAVAAAQERTEIGQRPRAVEHCAARSERVDRLPQQGLAGIPAGDDAGRALRDAERARRAERASELELLLGQALRVIGSSPSASCASAASDRHGR